MTLDADNERAHLERELFARSLRLFITGGAMRGSDGLPIDGAGAVAGAWDIIEPGNPLEWGWHLDAICEFLTAVSAGEIQNGAITAPPRFIKSILTSVVFPVWCWIQAPQRGRPLLGPQSRWITPSYAQELSVTQAVKSRNIMRDPWFRERWGDRVVMATDQDVKTYYANTQRGERHAVGVKGTITGKGADAIIVDDPINADEIHSEAVREHAKRWWTETMPSRLNDPRVGVKLMVGQRLHADDLLGVFIEQGATELSLPLEYDPHSRCVIPAIGYADPRTRDGELLPGRMTPKVRDTLAAGMTPHAFAAQYNQRTIPNDEDSEFPVSKWGRWVDLPRLEDGNYRRPDEALTSWDLTFEGNAASDWNVGTFWYRYGTALFYLLAMVRFKGSFVRQRAAMRAFDEACRTRFPFPPTKHLVEKKANGASVIDEAGSGILTDMNGLTDAQLKELSALPGVMGFNPDPFGGKVQRIMSTQGLVWAGNVVIPDPSSRLADVSFLPAWESEWQAFPNGKNDDVPDSGTQALLWFRRRPKLDIR